MLVSLGLLGINTEKTVEDSSPVPLVQSKENLTVPITCNITIAYQFLTTDKILKQSNGLLQPFTPEAASGLIANWIVETGSPTLTNLDVVERNGGAGRGLSQYTHIRRTAYDKARRQHIAAGGDPNSIDFQLSYMVDEYLGEHDPASGRSLIGWTRSFERFGQLTSPGDAAVAFSNSYFRPSLPHMSRRIAVAYSVHSQMTSV